MELMRSKPTFFKVRALVSAPTFRMSTEIMASESGVPA